MFGEGLKYELFEAGANEQEVLNGGLLMRTSQCGYADFLKDITIKNKFTKTDWKEMLIHGSGYPEDEEDAANIGKTIAMCNLKPLLFSLGEHLLHEFSTIARQSTHIHCLLVEHTSTLQRLMTFRPVQPRTTRRILQASMPRSP